MASSSSSSSNLLPTDSHADDADLDLAKVRVKDPATGTGVASKQCGADDMSCTTTNIPKSTYSLPRLTALVYVGLGRTIKVS